MTIVFGWRKDDEDPFAALKTGGTYQSAPTTGTDIGLGDEAPAIGAAGRVAVAPSPAPAVATKRAPRRRRRRRGYGLGIALVLRLAVLVAVIAAVAIPVATTTHSVESIKVPSIPITTPSPRQVNYLNSGNVRAALARVRRIVRGARLTLLRLDAKSFSVTASRPGHGAKEIYFGPAGSFVTAGSAAGQRGVPIEQIDPGVVGRLVADMRRRFHVPERKLDYVVLSSPPGSRPEWLVFTKTAAHTGYQATLSGGGLKPLGS